MPATRGQRQENDKDPPPTCLRPPKGGGCRKEGAGSGPPSPAGGAPGECTQRGQGEDKGHAACHTPQREDECRATCQCRACDVLTPEEGQRGRSPPPPAPTSRTHQGQRRGQRGEGEGTRGMTVAGGDPPPGTPRRGGETEGRDDRAQGGHAPCKPPRGDRRGCNRRKGRVTTGPTRQPPPPKRRDKCRATCLRRASDVLAQKGGQRECPPPRPLLQRPPAERARAARRQREDMGGGGKKKKEKKKKKHKASNQGHQHARAGTGSRGRRDMAGARGHSKGPGSAPLGMKAGRQGPTGGGGVTRAREQRW